MAPIYSHTNYREYLKQAFEKMMQDNPRLSYRSLNRQLGYRSSNFLLLVVSGQRNLTDDGIMRMQKLLKHNTKEAEFFEQLVRFTQAETQEQKAKYYEEICLFKAFQEVKKIDRLSYRYFSKWYYPAIREMILLKNFTDDARWIASRLAPSISPDEAKEAIELLVELGMAKYDKGGRLKPKDESIRTDDEVAGLSLLTFHSEMISRAREALDATPAEYREMLSMTVPINHQTFLEAKKRIRNFAHRMAAWISQSGPFDAVYQVNLHLFNLTRVPDEWKEDKSRG